MKRRTLLAAAVACLLPPPLAPRGPSSPNVLLDPAAAGMDTNIAARALFTGEIGWLSGFRWIETSFDGTEVTIKDIPLDAVYLPPAQRQPPPFEPAGTYLAPSRSTFELLMGSEAFDGARKAAVKLADPPNTEFITVEEWCRRHRDHPEDRYDR